MKISFCALFALTGTATSISIPVRFDRNGSPVANASISGTCIPMRVHMFDTIAVDHSAVLLGDVQVLTNEEPLALIDSRITFFGGVGRESLLGVGLNSFIRNEYGPIALTRNALVLNTSVEEFVSGCRADSYMALPINGPDAAGRWAGSVEIANVTRNVTLQLGGYVGRFISFPSDVSGDIVSRLIDNGAVELRRSISARERELVYTNCTNPFEGLPEVQITFNGIGAIVFLPEDYIYYDQSVHECFLRFMPPARMGGFYFINPLELPGTHIRLSNDLLEICDPIE